MNYIIKTPSATKLKKEIIDCVSSKVDANGKGIATWQCVETDASEKVLVHTTDQWAEKGCITIKSDISRNELQVNSIIGTHVLKEIMQTISICLVDSPNLSWFITHTSLIKL